MVIPTQYQKVTIILFLGAFLVLLSSLLYIRDVTQEVILKTQLKIAEQEVKLASISEVTDRDGADATVEKIIQDCSAENRARFDTQLSKLPTLRGAELVEIEQLFNACGNFFAERKAVMVSRLEREYEIYMAFIDILMQVDSKDATLSYDTKSWGTLVSLEKERSELSSRLVAIQGEIIRELKKNTPLTSDLMQETLVDGQKTKENLILLSQKIDEIRQKVLDL